MVKQTAGRDQLGGFADEFAKYNDDLLFGEIWSREDKLSLRDISMLTRAILMGKRILDSSLAYHIKNAKNNGLTKEEFVEIVTQLAFYTG